MKKIATLIFCLCLIEPAFSSMLWQLDYAQNLYNNKKYNEALEYLSGYTLANPNDEEGFYLLALTHRALNHEKQSQTSFKRAHALRLNSQNIDKIDFQENEFNNLEDYFDMAAMYFDEQNYQEAMNYADMMLKIDPDCAEAYFIKARVLKAIGDDKKAKEFINRAIILNNAILNTNLAQSLGIAQLPELSKDDCFQFATKKYFQGDLKGALEYAQKYLLFDKTNPDIYSLMLDCYIKLSDSGSFKSTLEEALENNKNNVVLLLKQAKFQKLKGEQYFETLKKAYSINPNNEALLLELGNYSLENKDYLKAKQYFETLISTDDALWEGYFGYIYSLIQLGQNDKAISQIKSTTVQNEKTSEVEYLLSQICSKHGNYKDALEYILQALKKEQNPLYNLEAGKLSYILGDDIQALNYLKLAPDCREKYEYLILCCLKNKNDKAAKNILNSTTMLDKNSILYKYFLYKINKEQGHIEEANSYMAQIKKAKPEGIEGCVELAKVYFLEGNIAQCEKSLNSAKKKFPSSAEPYFCQMEIYFMLNDTGKLKETIDQTDKLFN